MNWEKIEAEYETWKGVNPHLEKKFYRLLNDRDEIEKELSKPESKQDPEILERIQDYKEDLMDDGKRNYSNNPEKESPGRPKKETKKKKSRRSKK